MATEGPVTFLLNKMDALVSREYELLAGIHKAVEELRREFQTIEAFLIEADAGGGRETDGQFRVWVCQVRELAYDIEDGLDMYAFQFHNAARRFHRRHIRTRRSIAVLVEDINAKLERVRQTRDRYSQLPRPSPGPPPHTHFDRVAYLLETDSVGVEPVLTEFTNWAKLEDEPRLKVRFVVGMGGLGKTLLAKQLYEAVRPNFDCCGWIQCSRSQNEELALQTLLQELLQSTEELPVAEFQHQQMTVAQLMKQLTCFLKHRKYMIVIDDLWSIDLWTSIKCALPTTETHSRIVVTTRRGDIAHLCCTEQLMVTHGLQPLSWSAAQELFFRNAFPSSQGNHCPSGLLHWARKLLTQCEGWPLGIVMIGKYVSTLEQTAHAWRQLYDSLGSEMEKGGRLSSMANVVLSASYSDLPHHLKYCLLYFSIFPEDYSVRRRRLIRMWVSEGLAREETGKTPEEVGGNYLEELIQRNLVLVNEVDFDGRPKTCRVHRILHKIVLSISRRENFSSRVSTETEVGDRVRRLSFTGSARRLAGARFPCARSFLAFGLQDLSILSSFSVLKVLDLEGASQLDKFPKEILSLILLKYLSLRNTWIKKLPRKIWKLQNLETLDLKHTYVTCVPAKIFRLGKLRHLLIYRYSVMVYLSIESVRGFRASESIGKLVSLQKLTCLRANTDVAMLKALGNLTNLKKLGVVELREMDGAHLCCSIAMMPNLQTLDVAARKDEVLDLNGIHHKAPRMLQRLYLKGKLRKLPGWVSSLHDLVRIGLRWSNLEESPIDALQDLPNLKEIQLMDTYTGKQLVFPAGKFQSLKVLEVEKFEFLERIVIESGSLQRLQSLIMKRCGMVKHFPRGIGGLSELKELRLYDMPESLVRQIELGGAFRHLLSHVPFVCAYTSDPTGHWHPKVLS